MPREYAKHAVKLHIDSGYYNVLIAALRESKLHGSETAVGRADALLAKINKYTRFYSDEGTDYAEIRFFESEAKDLILLFLTAFHPYSPDDDDYCRAAGSDEENTIDLGEEYGCQF